MSHRQEQVPRLRRPEPAPSEVEGAASLGMTRKFSNAIALRGRWEAAHAHWTAGLQARLLSMSGRGAPRPERPAIQKTMTGRMRLPPAQRTDRLAIMRRCLRVSLVRKKSRIVAARVRAPLNTRMIVPYEQSHISYFRTCPAAQRGFRMFLPQDDFALVGGSSSRGRAHGGLLTMTSAPTYGGSSRIRAPKNPRTLPLIPEMPISPELCPVSETTTGGQTIRPCLAAFRRGMRRWNQQHTARGNRGNRANLKNLDKTGIGAQARSLAATRANRGNHPALAPAGEGGLAPASHAPLPLGGEAG